VFETDNQGNISYINQHGIRSWGYSQRDFDEGLAVLDMIVPEDRQRTKETIYKLVYEDGRTGYEYTALRKDGSTFPIVTISSRIVKDGEIMGLRGVVVDISERKLAEAKDRAGFQLLNHLRTATDIDECLRLGCQAIYDAGLFERSVLTLHNEEREIVNLGQVGLDEAIVQAARSAPAPDENLARQMTQERFLISHSFFVPEESGLSAGESPRAIAQPETSERGDSSWKCGDELFVPIIGAGGEYEGWLSVDTPVDGKRPTLETIRYTEQIVDIVTQKVRQIRSLDKLQESEETARAIMSATNEIMFLVDSELSLLTLNETASRSLGSTVDELIGKNFMDLIPSIIPADVAERRAALLRRVFREGKVVRVEDERAGRLFSNALYPIYDAESNVSRVAIIARDITLEKEAEREKLQASQERYEQVKRIAGGVAHEIYNSLFPAASCLDKLEDRLGHAGDEDRDRNSKLVDISREAVRRAVTMTQLVKDYSRLESEKMIQKVPLRSVIAEVLDGHQSRIDQLGVRTKLDIPENFALEGYRAHMHSLFTNLLINALDALEEVDNRQISVTARTRDGRRVVVFSDTGSGIPGDELPKVFDAFYSTKPSAGTGLGLAMVQKIAELYGGQVAVKSSQGQGTKFEIAFAAEDTAE
jgi:PAS domain S-box-containing protein